MLSVLESSLFRFTGPVLRRFFRASHSALEKAFVVDIVDSFVP